MDTKFATESSSGETENIDSSNLRKAYVTPVLQCLGSLTELTMGQGANNVDGFQTASS